MDLKEIAFVLNSPRSGQGSTLSSFEENNEFSGSTKGGEFE
jgi:hypothetical protein